MIVTQIEMAIIARLRLGLGQMARSVGSYGGELDEGLPKTIRSLPAAWVTFGGISKSEATGTRRQNFKSNGQFVVMVGDRSLRSEPASRQGGPAYGEVGSYPLVYAVRRLLMTQDFGLPIDPLLPGRVRTLYNTQLEGQAFAIFACEFHTFWLEPALANQHWPCPEGDADPDALFARYHGKLGQPDPDWLRTGLNYYLQQPDDGVPDAQDVVATPAPAPSESLPQAAVAPSAKTSANSRVKPAPKP